MRYETISLCSERPTVTLTSYICDSPKEQKIPPRSAVIVCPGGGYNMLSFREAEPIVRQYFAAGFNTYLLHYSVKENGGDRSSFHPLMDASLAIQYVREHSKEDHTDPNNVYIVGFSAGGHLAASVGVLWNHPAARAACGVDYGKAPEGINRPNGMILCYPVITTGEHTHLGTAKRLCGCENPTDDERKRFSLELHVDDTTPPAFLWHTATDAGVPVQNSILMMNALASHNIPFEAHIFPFGPHGASLGTAELSYTSPSMLIPHLQCWMDLSIKWIRLIEKRAFS